MVVLSTFTENTPWQVKIQRTVDLQGSSPQSPAVKDATVTISGNDGSFVELVHRGGGFYYSDESLPKTGVLYTLKAQASGYQSVEATDQIPNSIQIEKVQILAKQDLIKIELYDEADIRNYYQITVVSTDLVRRPFTVLNGELEDQMTQFAIQDPLVPDVSRPEVDMALIHDAPFNGKQFSIALSAYLSYLSGAFELSDSPQIERSVYISSTSKAYYDYYLSKFVQSNNKNLPFSEPTPVISNVINGHGVFAGYNLYVGGSKITPETIKQSLIAKYELEHYNSEYPERHRSHKIEFSLHEDMSVTGFMNFPQLSPNTAPQIVSLAGGFSITQSNPRYEYVVELHHDATTFFKDAQLEIRDSNNITDNGLIRVRRLVSRQGTQDIHGQEWSVLRSFSPID